MKINVGQVLRYARPYGRSPQIRDGYLNYFAATHTQNMKMALLEAGINAPAKVGALDGSRRPAVLISSSPHKIGSHATPWQDVFDTDNGHIRYFGDNKEPGNNPALAFGNRVLLEQFEYHSALERDARSVAAPLLFFRRVARGGRTKGLVRFEGFGIIRGVELVTQYDRKRDLTFSNYAFDFSVLSLAKEHEEFDWAWISARRDQNVSIEEADKLAPTSWREWTKAGPLSLNRVRRRVSSLMTTPAVSQRPTGKQEKTLQTIYSFYSRSRHRFEALAAYVVQGIIEGNGGQYRAGWITPSGSDGGADFIGRLDIGQGFAKTKLIVLGQAKCESFNKTTGGNHVARTVARLKRGWIGAYVTLGAYSEAVQREVLEDGFPIMLVNGGQVAEQVEQLAIQRGVGTVRAFLEIIDAEYDSMIQQRRPEEILLE